MVKPTTARGDKPGAIRSKLSRESGGSFAQVNRPQCADPIEHNFWLACAERDLVYGYGGFASANIVPADDDDGDTTMSLMVRGLAKIR